MKEEDKKLMDKHGITYEQRTVFFYQNYKYERLEDAVNYANTANAEPGSEK